MQIYSCNGISLAMVFLLTCLGEHIPWIKRRKFIQRDKLYLCKLGLISIIYAKVIKRNIYSIIEFLEGCFRKYIPWNERRIFIQRDTLYICKLGTITIIYAN